MDGKLLGAVIHIHMIQMDMGILFVTDRGNGPSPQAGGCQHVGFVHACHMAAALSGCFHGKAGNSFHFRNRVAFYVPGPFHAVIDFRFAPFSEINTAHQFPNDHNVRTSGDFRFQRRVFNHGIRNLYRAEVHIKTQGFAKSQDGLFRPERRFQVIPLVSAYGTEEDGIPLPAGLYRILRQRHTIFIIGRAAGILPLIGEIQMVNFIGFL